jgi:hypothetical protein
MAAFLRGAETASSPRHGLPKHSTPRGKAVVTFVDRLRHAGIAHMYSCEQVLEFTADGTICRITHLELTGERAALSAFLQHVGITR